MNESKQEIMESTYTALSKHGYAGLSIQKIADESEKAKSAIYYHFDDKDDLMLAFLDYLEHHIEQTHSDIMEEDIEDRLDHMLDMALGIEDDEQWEFQKAFLELRAQASHNQEFAEKFGEIDSMIIENMSEIMEQLDVEDPELMAEILVSCIEGTVNRKVSTGDREGLENMKESLEGIVEQFVVEDCGC